MFGVKAGKFLGFLLTEIGIEANPEKCVAIIGMRSPTNIKEVQQFSRRMSALSASGDKEYPYFQFLKKQSFCMDHRMRGSLHQVKRVFGQFPILGKPVPDTPVCYYFAVTDRAINSVILLDQDKVQKQYTL